jgi:hypothetical protein
VNKGHLFREISGGNDSDDIYQMTEISISRIVAIYEVLEKDLFIYIIDFISPEYKVMQLDDVTTN